MPSDRISLAIADIIEHAQLALEFVGGQSWQALVKDKRTWLAIVRCLEIVSEASRRMPIPLKEKYPQIQWKQIAGAGNIYRHGYDAVDAETVVSTVTDDLPALLRVMRDAQTTAW